MSPYPSLYCHLVLGCSSLAFSFKAVRTVDKLEGNYIFWFMKIYKTASHMAVLLSIPTSIIFIHSMTFDYLFVWFFLLCFSKVGSCYTDWHWTHDGSASTSWVLRLQMWQFCLAIDSFIRLSIFLSTPSLPRDFYTTKFKFTIFNKVTHSPNFFLFFCLLI